MTEYEPTSQPFLEVSPKSTLPPSCSKFYYNEHCSARENQIGEVKQKA